MLIKKQTTIIAGPVADIELMLARTDQPCDFSAIICHPHPLHLGSMHNKVVTTISKALLSLNIKTLCFNFRGVGDSGGVHDHGLGEFEDATFLYHWLQSSFPNDQFIFAGFSFGAYIAAQLAASQPCHTLITVAPAVNHSNYNSIENTHCRWLLYAAGKDEIVPIAETDNFITHHQQPDICYLPLADATHFFHGHLTALRDSIKSELTPLS